MSTEEYATTPVSQIRNQNSEVSIIAWGDHHDVYEWLLPIENREQYPLEVVQRIRDYLFDIPDTQETVTKADMGLDQHGNRVVREIMKLFQITEFDTATRPYRFRVPDYPYYDERTVAIDTDERHEHYAKWRDTPTTDSHFFAHHWGCKRKTALGWIEYNYDGYKEQRQYNRARLARSLETHRRWTGDQLRTVIDPLPMNYHTAKDLVRRFALNADEWHPPERPTGKTWYND